MYKGHERPIYQNDQEDIICNKFKTNNELKTLQIHDNRFTNEDERFPCKGGSTNKNKQFFCTICNNSFSSKSNLKKHERKFCKSGSIKINSEDQKRVANKDGRFPCRKCNHTFKTKPIVKVHEKKSCKGKEAPANKKRRLAHENEIFQCIHCTQTFNSKCNLKRHEKKSCKKTRGSGV